MSDLIRILIAEDERPIAELLRMTCTHAGYTTAAVQDGIACADLLERGERFDLILLDVMLPGADGFELMHYIRPLGIPVIFLTARTSVADRVRGLHLGAEDYICKPFSVDELLARIEVVLRRDGKLQNILSLGDLTVDVRSRTVCRASESVHLTGKEFDLMLFFLRNPDIALYRDTIYERVWGGEWEAESRTVDLHVQRLRRKLGWEERLQSVPRVGYRLSTKN